MVRLSLFAFATLALFLVACGGSDYTERTFPDRSPSPSPSATPTPVETPVPPKEVRVAFISLFGPQTVNPDNKIVGETFDERLDIIIKQLKDFGPDIVGFNDSTVTTAYGNAATKLAKELKMEKVYARANPWFQGQTYDQSGDLAKQIGFEEGELILVRSDRFPIVGAPEIKRLNPLSSESGEGRTALHVVVKGPPGLGEIDIFITHLTIGGDKVRLAQANDFVNWVLARRGAGPTLVMGDMGDPVGSSTYSVYSKAGFHDVAGPGPVGTCCRESIVGEQPPLTARTDYLLSDRWQPIDHSLFGDTPTKRPDGTLIYASDHNGLMAIFPVPPPATAEPPGG